MGKEENKVRRSAAGRAAGRDVPAGKENPQEPRDVRAWLGRHGHEAVVELIDKVIARWKKAGKRTRRNWWDVLAGDSRGRPRTVDGTTFPVLSAARARQRRANAAAAVVPRQGHDGAPRESADAPPQARPFLKWAGGKRQLSEVILSLLPSDFGTFHEPFLGGGAIFFGLRPRAAVLSDRNERLIRAYRGIKTAVGDVIDILKTFRNDKRFFLAMRKRPVDAGSDAEVAAWMIFLNKTGFNGLYRVNSRNQFNVPFAANPKVRFCNEDNLRACAAALAAADLRCDDFGSVVARARPGDVVYFDPPYVPLSVTSSFTSYTSHGFEMADQVRLRDVAVELTDKGVFVLLSNSSAPIVRELYQKRFDCVPVSALRLVNSDPRGRGRVTELLIKSKAMRSNAR
ncbi:MAG: Dam family site-specific DNA-(adenine-N6)-methyltransferase [Bacteroidota bacterium]